MLNQTIISSIQITVPLLAESITKNYGLDSRWVTVLQMTFNSMLQLVSFSDDVAMYIIMFLCSIVSICYIDTKTNGILSRGLFIFIIKRFKSNSGCFLYEYEGNVRTLIESYLYRHPEVFDKAKPSWLFKDTYRSEESGVSTVGNNGMLKDGSYPITISDELKFQLNIQTVMKTNTKGASETRRAMEYRFIFGR